MSKTCITAILITAASWLPTAAHAEPIRVVASFSILGDMVRQIGGDDVVVQTLVGPDGDAHVFQPSPRDTRALADADLVVENGLGLEGWMPRLVEASGFKGPRVVASDGITPIAGSEEEGEAHEDHAQAHDEEAHEDHAHDHDEEAHDHDHAAHGHDHGPSDPHAWQDLANGIVYARNIAAGLEAADPAHADAYRQRSEAYIGTLTALDAELRAALAKIPPEHRKVVTSHDAFGYFAHAYGIDFIAPEGVSTESEASAADVARIINQIRDEKITAVFVENISDRRLVDQITRESGAVVGGTLFSDALSGPDGPAPTYVEMFHNNMRQIVAALTGA